MTPVTSTQGKTVAVFGLGGSGLATMRALAAGGASPVCWDDAPAKVDEARRAGFAVEDLRNCDWRRFAALILAPGVPLTHPKPHWSVDLAKAAGVEVIGDIELFCRQRAEIAPGSPFIAVTGTNGKSTTTALIAHILSQAGLDVQMGGNIGTPILALEPPAAGRFHVVECSSFQIDLAPSLAPGVGVLLNITPDHLDRHGTMERYAAIKERLVERAGVAVVGVDDARCIAVFDRLRSRSGRESPVPIGDAAHEDLLLGPLGFAYTSAEILEIRGTQDSRAARAPDVVASLANIASLRGLHNAQNAAAAYAAVSCAMFFAGVSMSNRATAAAIRSFPGLPHRMEEVARVGRAIFINDSKATNADSTEKALLSFAGGIFWILGGKPKEGGIESLEPLFGRIERAYLIGAATEEFAATLAAGDVAHERCGTLEAALRHAARDAAASRAAEPVVLLSPACASYDQFKNFEERGNRFRELVENLAEAQGAFPSPLAGEGVVRFSGRRERGAPKGQTTPAPGSTSSRHPLPQGERVGPTPARPATPKEP